MNWCEIRFLKNANDSSVLLNNIGSFPEEKKSFICEQTFLPHFWFRPEEGVCWHWAEARRASGPPPPGRDLLSAPLLNNACRPVTSTTPPDSHGTVSSNHLYLHSAWWGKVSACGSRHVNVQIYGVAEAIGCVRDTGRVLRKTAAETCVFFAESFIYSAAVQCTTSAWIGSHAKAL